MRKLTALLCTAAMTLSMAATAFAVGSIPGTGVENADATVVGNPDIQVVIAAADTANFKSEAAKAGVDYLKNTDNPTVVGMYEELGVDPTEPVTIEGVGTFVPEDCALILKEFISISADADVELIGDEKAQVTLNAEALKGADPENLIIMSVDPDAEGEEATVDYLGIAEDELNSETGELKKELPFPITFTILEKSDAEAE